VDRAPILLLALVISVSCGAPATPPAAPATVAVAAADEGEVTLDVLELI